MAVVMAEVGTEDSLKVAPVDHEQLIEAPDRKPLGDSVGVRGPVGHHDALRALGLEDLIEAVDVFSVPVTKYELDVDIGVVKIGRDIAGLLGH
jgi:hypothetical protein